ncbi:class I SAM-dependent methyltransferase [Thalassotalea sp. M1531]|uniref:Class I SAM-dependent methyltransferase n=1 Tax=Thalassotalea algicola TaxID=2716224 RepID=A0A7Y0Q8G9_9GAMM|nr:class I SAM-dependent methyltransferase [Thalassotalea algicola]NMP32897.1 class I SAM-dependent methyltransferase [Thalassotalea algicola]
MTSFTTKQKEWQQQVEAAQDLKAQVGRPIDEQTWQELVTDIKDKLQLTVPINRLLDLGCGNALILSELASYAKELYGIDYADAMITQAKKVLPDAHFQTGQADHLPFSDKTFSRLLCYSIFHYFPDQTYVIKAIEEMIRVTEKGGVILIGDLLDAEFEQAIKSGSNLDYEQKIPHIHRYSEWTFCDLVFLQNYFNDKVSKIEILEQPESFPLRHYRKDLRITC